MGRLQHSSDTEILSERRLSTQELRSTGHICLCNLSLSQLLQATAADTREPQQFLSDGSSESSLEAHSSNKDNGAQFTLESQVKSLLTRAALCLQDAELGCESVVKLHLYYRTDLLNDTSKSHAAVREAVERAGKLFGFAKNRIFMTPAFSVGSCLNMDASLLLELLACKCHY